MPGDNQNKPPEFIDATMRELYGYGALKDTPPNVSSLMNEAAEKIAALQKENSEMKGIQEALQRLGRRKGHSDVKG